MKKLLLSILIAAPLMSIAQVANPEWSYARVSNSGYTVSTTDESSNTPVDNLVDGDSTTFWETASGSSFPHTFTVNMQAAQNIDGIYFINRPSWVGARNLDSVEIYTSVDSSNWTLQVQKTLATTTVVNAGFSNGTVNCQYYKVIVYTVGSNGANTTSDFINLGETGALVKNITDPNAYTRTGWTVTASSESDSHLNLLDNNFNTFWQSNWSVPIPHFPHILTVDMGVTQPINQIAYVLPSTTIAPVQYNSQADSGVIVFSNDGINFTDSVPIKFDYASATATDRSLSRKLFNLGSVHNVRYFQVVILRNHFDLSPTADSTTNEGGYFATSLSEIGADYDASLSTPVKLASFTAQASGKTVNLNWNTATELNSNYFNITRSTDGKNFTSIGQVKAAGTPHSYSFTDVSPAAGTNYYQLVAVDLDGASSKSDIVSTNIAAGQNNNLTITKATNSGVTLSINAAASGTGQIVIYNIAGQQVAAQTAILQAGNNNVQVNFNSASGVYIVNIITNGNKLSQKFFKP